MVIKKNNGTINLMRDKNGISRKLYIRVFDNNNKLIFKGWLNSDNNKDYYIKVWSYAGSTIKFEEFKKYIYNIAMSNLKMVY